LEQQAYILVEASNLLLIPGRNVLPPGHEDEIGPGSLTASQIRQKIDTEWDAFSSFAQAFRDAGTVVLTAVQNKNADAVFESGGPLDEVCEGCHTAFWYSPPK
jgi:cytochrome c556